MVDFDSRSELSVVTSGWLATSNR